MMSQIAQIATTESQRRLGFLAMKAEQYAKYPSIRKMSGDWHHIASIAAEGYNIIDALRRENDSLKEDIAFIKQAAMGD